MITPLPMAERHAFGMETLAEMSGKLVQITYERAIRSSDPEEQDRAILLFDRLARGFRLTIALEAKMDRDRRRDAAGVSPGALPVQTSPPNLPPPVAGPRPARPAREGDHERDVDLEPGDVLGHIQDLRRLVVEEANILDPDGVHAQALDRYAAWMAEAPREEPEAARPADPPSARSRKGRASWAKPPRRASG